MTTLVFPYLPGLSWPVERSPGDFDTTIQVAVSGKENRYANRTQARYKYTLSFDGLDSNGRNSGLIANSMQTLAGFFNQCRGGALIFNFFDVDDSLATAQAFGTGDGSTVAFQLCRASGGWTDNVFAPLVSASPVTVPSATGGTTTAPYPEPLIYDNGSLVSSSAYSVSAANGVITFNAAPVAGHALTWTGNYYWPCNFDADSIALSKFMSGLWEAKKVSFTTRVF
jgi:uncharacterized protein (TIGR02217 family)